MKIDKIAELINNLNQHAFADKDGHYVDKGELLITLADAVEVIKGRNEEEMTSQEAIYIIKSAIAEVEWNYPLDYAEAFDMAIEALEKQIPKRPIYEADGYSEGELVYDTWYCPNCDMRYEVYYDRHRYCPNCGQSIDWSEK